MARLTTLATLARAAAALPLVVTTSLAQLPSMRPDVGGPEAAVTSDHVLASAAGMDVLKRGGNAVDAAITMAAVLTVVRPHMNGPGGDNFMLIRLAKTGEVIALNGSGRAGSKATPAFFQAKGLKAVPGTGILSVSVPGAVRGWADALQKHGTITLSQALQPAIRYAERGFPVSPRLNIDINESKKKLAADPELARTFLPNGEAPPVGSLLKQADLARTLRAIATSGPDAVYKGAIARQIAEFMDREGGLLTADDLAKHRSTWEKPISTTYLGNPVLAFPPNTQGVTLLEALNIAELSDLKPMARNSAAYIHALVEGAKLAYADRDKYVADPAFSEVPVERLISKDYAADLARRLRDKLKANDGSSNANRDGTGDTVFLGVVDKDGNAVSMIQSLFAAFGSGRMVPGTGITLHNRGSLYELDSAHPNVIAPGKRPFHTLCPAMVLRPDRSLMMVVGTPGGDGQPQTLVQVITNILQFGLTPQQAVEGARFRWYGRERVGVEPGIAADVRDALTRRGHQLTVQEPSEEFGGAQVIMVTPSGGRIAGADPRREAYAIAW
ncbi:MAG TPA: gamma-glutamyltransferase [Gemmatimonadaceae bacterium]|nr:gamma-glutamyltransferase [Gemmatimonadaceae bacterium]